MGLLDEAIREHLELKRRRGADPGEVARAERAALEPVFDEQPGEARDAHQPEHHDGDGDGAAHEDSHPDHMAGGEQAVSMGADADGRGAEPQLADFGSPGQETAEIDMRAVLEEDHRAPGLDASADLPAAQHAPASGSAEEDGPEWEMPGREARDGPPEQVPGQERLSFE
jgi:hypothetical protein